MANLKNGINDMIDEVTKPRGDVSHFFKELHKTIGGGDSWVHKPSKINYIHNEPFFDQYEIEKIPIDDLIKYNDLDNKDVLSNHASIWSKTGDPEDLDLNGLRYDESKDNDVRDIIYGTRKPDGRIILSNGRHRIRALKNNGIKNVVIPIHDEFVGSDPLLVKDYYSKDLRPLRVWQRNLDALDYTKEQKKIIKDKLRKRVNYLKMIDNIKKRR